MYARRLETEGMVHYVEPVLDRAKDEHPCERPMRSTQHLDCVREGGLVRVGHVLRRPVGLFESRGEKEAHHRRECVDGCRDDQHDRDGAVEDAGSNGLPCHRAARFVAGDGPARTAQPGHEGGATLHALEVEVVAVAPVERQAGLEVLPYFGRGLDVFREVVDPRVAAKAAEAVQARVSGDAVALV